MKISANRKAGTQAFYEAGRGWSRSCITSGTTRSLSHGRVSHKNNNCNLSGSFASTPVTSLCALPVPVPDDRHRDTNTTKTIEARIRRPSVHHSADGAVAIRRRAGGRLQKGGGGGYAVDGHDYPVPADPNCNGSACNTAVDGSPSAKPGLYTVMTLTLTGNVSAHLGSPTNPRPSRERSTTISSTTSTNNLFQTTLGTRRIRPSRSSDGATLNGSETARASSVSTTGRTPDRQFRGFEGWLS